MTRTYIKHTAQQYALLVYFVHVIKRMVYMRFTKLTDKTLLASYYEAIKLNISSDFIKILEKEILERGLPLESVYNKKQRKIN